jgi:mutator protein MutT
MILSRDSPFSPVDAARIVLETPNCVAFLDKYPVADGHTLVVPRRTVGSLYDMPEAVQAEIWDTVRRARAILAERFNPAGFNIGVNDGAAAGQTIPHAHVHIIPRHAGDVPDPRGGIRWVIPIQAAYWTRKETVTAAILQRGTTVLLTRRAEGEKLAGSWEFPGGKVHEGESPEACLARELQEELSLCCSVGRKVAESEYCYEHGTFTILAYEAQIRSGTLKLAVHDRAEWVEVAALLRHNLVPADIPIAEVLQSLSHAQKPSDTCDR